MNNLDPVDAPLLWPIYTIIHTRRPHRAMNKYKDTKITINIIILMNCLMNIMCYQSLIAIDACLIGHLGSGKHFKFLVPV